MKKNKTAAQIIAQIAKNPEFSPREIRTLMERLDMNERGFALLMNTSIATVRGWTSGQVCPCGVSRRLMQFYAASPDAAEIIVNSACNS